MNDDQRIFLEHFPANQRSTVANLFLRQVRGGRSTDTAVYAGAYAEERERTERRYAYATDTDRAILDAMRRHYDEAMDFARWCIAYEQLTPEQKARRKRDRATENIGEWQKSQPPTEKQIDYLRHLGYHGTIEDRAHASSLIDIYKRGGRVEVSGAA